MADKRLLLSLETIFKINFLLFLFLNFKVMKRVQQAKWSGLWSTGLSKKIDGIWNRYNLKSTGRIYTFGILKCSEKFKVLDLP